MDWGSSTLTGPVYWAHSLIILYTTAVDTPSEEYTGYDGTEKNESEWGETNEFICNAAKV